MKMILVRSLALVALSSWLGGPSFVMADEAEVSSVALLAQDGGEISHDVDLDGDLAGGVHDADEHAAEEGSSLLSFDFGSAVFNLIIFLCVFGILSTFVWPSVLGGLKAREEKIREDLESAEKSAVDAKALVASYESKLNEASAKVQQMLADARRDAEANAQKIVEHAKVEAASQRERALADIETAKKVAMADMATQTSQLAMQVARGIVGRELSSNDHSDLIRQAMDRIPSQN